MKEPEQEQTIRQSEEKSGVSPSSGHLVNEHLLLTRREWIRLGALGLLGAGLPLGKVEASTTIPHYKIPHLQNIADAGSMVTSQGVNRRGYVAEVVHENVFPLGGYQPNVRAVNKMLGTLMMMLTKQSSPAKSWSKLVGPGDRVSILVDAEGSPVTRTRKALIDCVILALRQAGVHPNNIIVWTTYGRLFPAMGLNLNWNRPGIKVLGAPQMGFDKRFGLKQAGGIAGSSYLHLSKIVTTYSSHIINIATLEDHPILGCRLCLAQQAIASLQRGKILERFWGGARGIAPVAAWPMMKKKFVLHLIDGLAGTFNGLIRPWRPQLLLGGTDPVAVDRQGFALIDSQRRKSGVPVITGTRRTPVHINNAALLGVGVANLMQINHQKVTLK